MHGGESPAHNVDLLLCLYVVNHDFCLEWWCCAAVLQIAPLFRTRNIRSRSCVCVVSRVQVRVRLAYILGIMLPRCKYETGLFGQVKAYFGLIVLVVI